MSGVDKLIYSITQLYLGKSHINGHPSTTTTTTNSFLTNWMRISVSHYKQKLC